MRIENVPDIEVIEHLDFDAELGCEGERHAEGGNSCIPSQSASYVVIKPCCSHRPLCCEGGATAGLTGGLLECVACDAITPRADWSYEPIRARK